MSIETTIRLYLSFFTGTSPSAPQPKDKGLSGKDQRSFSSSQLTKGHSRNRFKIYQWSFSRPLGTLLFSPPQPIDLGLLWNAQRSISSSQLTILEVDLWKGHRPFSRSIYGLSSSKSFHPQKRGVSYFVEMYYGIRILMVISKRGVAYYA